MQLSRARTSEVKELMLDGLDVQAIAKNLDVKVSTAERYMRHVRDKYIPRILEIDIETLPMEVLVWGLYKQRISHDSIIKEWSIVSWAAKWLFESEIMSMVLTPKQAIARDDSSIIKGIWDLLEEADIVIAHNAQRFDIRRLNSRFMLNGLTPPMPYQVVDTLKQSRKYMAHSSHRLDHLSKLLGHSGKVKTTYGLWKSCIGLETDLKGQKQALKDMVKYNCNDVLILEDFYVELRPWMGGHPNLGVYVEAEGSVCPRCLNKKLTWKGHYSTQAGKYRSFRCDKCKAIGRSRLTSYPKDIRKKLAIPTAR